jgi:hypothetical protein
MERDEKVDAVNNELAFADKSGDDDLPFSWYFSGESKVTDHRVQRTIAESPYKDILRRVIINFSHRGSVSLKSSMNCSGISRTHWRALLQQTSTLTHLAGQISMKHATLVNVFHSFRHAKRQAHFHRC